jgi:uncharacterized membrane protein
VSKPETVEFAPAVLLSLPALVPSGMVQADLALELGLTAYMEMSGTELDDAIGQMWDIRTAVLEAGDLDSSTEPIPFGGSSRRIHLLNLALYLGNLVDRAAAHQGCDSTTIVARAMDRPVLQQIRRSLPDIRQLRSS